MERDRISVQRIFREPIAEALGIILHIQAPSLPVQLAKGHAEQPRPQISALHRLGVDALDLSSRPPVRSAAHRTTHRVVRATDPVLRNGPRLIQFLIKAHGRLRHLNRSHAIRENLSRLESQIDAVGQLPLRTEQRAIIQRHRVMFVIPHRGHAQLERRQDLAHASRAEPALVLDLIREIHERALAMIIGQFHRVPQIKIHRRRAIGINLPHPIIPLPVNLPNDHAIRVRGVSDTLAQLLRAILGRRTRNVIILLRVPTDLLNRLRITLPTQLRGHTLIRRNTHRHHMHRPVRILQINRIRRDHEIHRINRLESHPLITGIPEALHHTTPTHQRVIHPAQHLIHEIGLLPNLVIEPILSHAGISIQLLAHRNKAGHYIHPKSLLEE